MGSSRWYFFLRFAIISGGAFFSLENGPPGAERTMMKAKRDDDEDGRDEAEESPYHESGHGCPLSIVFMATAKQKNSSGEGSKPSRDQEGTTLRKVGWSDSTTTPALLRGSADPEWLYFL